MESVGVYHKEDWEYSLSKMFSGDEESDSMLHFLQNFGTSSDFLATGEATGNVAVFDDQTLYYSYQNPSTNLYLISQDTSDSNYTSASFANPCSNVNHSFSDSVNLMNDMNIVHHESMNNLSGTTTPDEETSDFLHVSRGDCNVMQDILCFKEENETGNYADGSTDLGLKRKFEVAQLSEPVKDINTASANPKKKSRVPRDTQKNKRNAQAAKNQKFIKIDNKSTDTESPNVLSSSASYSSEDDSNASQELNGGLSNIVMDTNTPKSRANRGAATDPQSLYARKRRERINERLRILQNLVPNGTKVDISTMLEEAVQYVKFLQLQIKLLSSDDTWMYAPIAYNGMDMGLYQNISSRAI